jgi:tungstate transport system substrate-binding protein
VLKKSEVITFGIPERSFIRTNDIVFKKYINIAKGFKMMKSLKAFNLTIFAMALIVAAIVISSQAAPKQKNIILATTTSTQDTGLLDVLIPIFEKETGYFVKTIAVGSGQAMAMGQKGEADVLLVHSPDAEKKFIAEGYGINRRLVMHNDFIIVGSGADQAKIKNIKSAAEAFKTIAWVNALFVSRGDNSGTYSQEMKLWKAAGVNPEGQKWYQQTGLGMGQTLNVAAEKKGYTLADRGTYLALKKTLGMDILVEGDAALLNIYHVIEVNADKWPKVNADGAKAFADFMVSKRTQDIIKSFGVDKYGSVLFFPDAGKKVEDLSK